jgi:hypothetical protein
MMQHTNPSFNLSCCNCLQNNCYNFASCPSCHHQRSIDRMFTPRIAIGNQDTIQPHGGPLGNQYCATNHCAANAEAMTTSPPHKWLIISIRFDWVDHSPTATTCNHCAIHVMRLSQERNRGCEAMQ